MRDYVCTAFDEGSEVVATWPRAESLGEAEEWLREGIDKGAWQSGQVSSVCPDSGAFQIWLVLHAQPAQPALRV